MKHRSAVLAFNSVVGFLFLFLFPLPVILFGPSYAVHWSRAAIPAFLCFAVILIAANLEFRSNGKIYGKVRSGDWQGLADFLEPLIIAPSGRVRHNPLAPFRLRIFVDSCILLEDFERIDRIEKRLSDAGSRLLASEALSFGLARFVRNRVDEAAAFFEKWLDNPKTENRNWLRFAFGLCRVLQGRFADSKQWLIEAAYSRDAVLSAAAAYLLGTMKPLLPPSANSRGEAEEVSREARKRIRDSFPGKKLDAEFDRARGELHVVFFGSILEDARMWVEEGVVSDEGDFVLNGGSVSADIESR